MCSDLLFVIAQYLDPSTIRHLQRMVIDCDLNELLEDRLQDKYVYLFQHDPVYIEASAYRTILQFMKDKPRFEKERLTASDRLRYRKRNPEKVFRKLGGNDGIENLVNNFDNGSR